jgi:hypothetical protein
MGHGKDFGFLSKKEEKPLKGSQQGRGMLTVTSRKDDFVCCVDNQVVRQRVLAEELKELKVTSPWVVREQDLDLGEYHKLRRQN